VNKTKNDLPQKTREAVIKILNARLADSFDLVHQTKQAHWNVKGENFIALHKLFDAIVDDAEEYTDLLAERVVQLGVVAEWTVQQVAQHSQLAEYPREAHGQHAHIEVLSSALAAFGKSARKAIDESDELGDRDSADIFTEISRGTDEWLFVEAHLA
jgi:starvation-inducible DNA-binding protein